MKEFLVIVGVAWAAVSFIATMLLVSWALTWSPLTAYRAWRLKHHAFGVVVKLQDWRR